ncbi:hypothetical protein ACO0LF_25785 [Undibacterium sp. Di27W]|uniref:hypothetical protein n=1 Tax=Undibacterium sp. Di27W TaxID=3413036 RepID=UPI003BF02BF0
MKAKYLFLTVSICFATGLLSACGGGINNSSNSTGNSNPQTQVVAGPSLRGTAATGLAIADANLSVKCRGASGSTKTAADGTFSISMAAGSTLPCVLETSNPANGRKLHAIAINAGIINLTPLTEMLSTRLMLADMKIVFANPDFDAINKTVTAATIKTAQADVSAVLSGLLDTGSLSEFYSTPLKAAASSAPGTGDSQDKILDTLNLTLASNLYEPLLNMLSKITPAMMVFGRQGCLVRGADGQTLSCSGPGLWETAGRIDIFPAAMILEPGSKQVLSAKIDYLQNVNYLRQPVTWQVVEADGGSISSNGEYIAPLKPGIYHVRAQREDFPTLSATAMVIVNNTSTGFIPTLSVEHHIVNVMPGGSIALKADMNYPPNIMYIRQPVSWSIVEADAGEISLLGNYIAPAKSGTYHVKVQRDDFPSIYVVVDILVNYPPD